MGEESDNPRYHRGFTVITNGEVSRPIPVIGLVRGEIKRGKPDIEKAEEEKPEG